MDVINILLEITIYSGIIFITTMLLKKCFKKSMSPFLHYAVWAVLILRLMMPVTIASPVHLFVIPDSVQNQTVSGGYADAQAYKPAAEPQTDNEGLTTLKEPQASLSEPVQNQTELKTETRTQLSTPQIIILLWLAGAGLSLIYLSVLYAVLRRRFRRNAACPSKRLKELFEEVKAELGISANIKLVCQYEYGTPSLMFPKTLMMPVDALVAMNDEQAKFALRHELTHFKRRDHIVSIFLSILNAVYWFNPFVWLAMRQIRTDMEIACDSTVVKRLNADGRRRYASLVVNLFSQPVHRQLVLGMAQADARKVAEQRVRGIFMNGKSGRSVKLITALLAVIMLLTCFTTACQPTPKIQVVVNKGNGAINSAIRQTAQAQAAYKAPTALKYSNKIENVTVNIAAPVSVPDVSSFGVYKVKIHDVQQDEVDKYVKALLGNGPYYDAGLTKEYYDEQIIRTKQSISDIENMADDKFKDIYDPDETKDSVIAALNGEINEYTKEREAAPSSNERRPIDTKFKQYKNVKGWFTLQVFADTDKGIAKASIEKFTDSNTQYSYEFDAANPSLTISQKQASSFASEFLKKLNLQDDYTIYNSQLVPSSNIFTVKSGPIWNHPNGMSGKYYVFDYTRVRGGVPTNVIDGMPAMVTDATNVQPKADEAYSYFPDQERMQMLVNDSGVISFYWRNHDDSVETTNKNASLLSFEKIQDIIEKSSVYTKFFVSQDKNAELKITGIELGYMRVKSPDEQDRYIIIPVWDVIGKKVEPDFDSSKKGEMPDMSFLTINALDGSIIDRNKGY